MSNKKPTVEYRPREELDAELESAIREILGAETEARGRLEQAEQAVKALQLDAATRERAMRDDNAKSTAVAAASMLADAEKRAAAECARLEAEAKKEGEALVKSKQKDIDKIAAELFAGLKGKK